MKTASGSKTSMSIGRSFSSEQSESTLIPHRVDALLVLSG